MRILSQITENKDIVSKEYVDDGLAYKQPTLVSGTNIKTINNQSLLGSGNITISGGGTPTDVQVNGTSIVSNNVANILTNTAYNASSNKIATMNDLSDVEKKLIYNYNGTPYYYQFYGVKSIDNITVNVGTEVDVVYATLLLISMDIESMKQSYPYTLPAILGIRIPTEDYITTTLVVVIHNLGIMTCEIDASTRYVTSAVFTNYAQGYSVNFGANPNELTVYYSAVNSEDYLRKDNTISYVPSTDYNPATKAYVDTTIAAEISNAITTTLNTPV